MSRIVAILAPAKPPGLVRLAATIQRLPSGDGSAVTAGMKGTKAVAAFAKRLRKTIEPLSDEIREEVEPLGEAILECGDEYLEAARSGHDESPENPAESALNLAKAARHQRRAEKRFPCSEPASRDSVACQPVTRRIALA